MLALKADDELLDQIAPEAAPAELAALDLDDDLAPARGIALGAGLGLVSLGIVVTLFWWVL